jgi:phosphopantothenoylcysteine decarboxylase/phosphopantothenate--cysteine ligase
MLKNKNIGLGVCGSIAAYKACYLASLLIQQGAHVNVFMTTEAEKFVTPLSFSSLTNNPVLTNESYFRDSQISIAHIKKTKKLDIFLIAPATANIISKAACGIADEILSASILAADCPVAFAPAMHHSMFEKPIIQENIRKLLSRGYYFINPEKGNLASGDKGIGRLASRERIIDCLQNILGKKKDFYKKKILISAGPTQEPIDPLRFVSNLSSGKMGYALANTFIERDADVTLVSGPCEIDPPQGLKKYITIKTASDLNKVFLKEYLKNDIIVMNAAVCDFKPEKVFPEKIKCKEDFILSLKRNPDILKELGKNKGKRILVGFSLDTSDNKFSAQAKLKEKNLDIIFANNFSPHTSGPGEDFIEGLLIFRKGLPIKIDRISKIEAAEIIVDSIAKLSR